MAIRHAFRSAAVRPRAVPAAMRTMGSYGPSTDSQPNSVDGKFQSDRIDKVRFHVLLQMAGSVAVGCPV